VLPDTTTHAVQLRVLLTAVARIYKTPDLYTPTYAICGKSAYQQASNPAMPANTVARQQIVGKLHVHAMSRQQAVTPKPGVCRQLLLMSSQRTYRNLSHQTIHDGGGAAVGRSCRGGRSCAALPQPTAGGRGEQKALACARAVHRIIQPITQQLLHRINMDSSILDKGWQCPHRIDLSDTITCCEHSACKVRNL